MILEIFLASLYASLLSGPLAKLFWPAYIPGLSTPCHFVVHVSCPAFYVVSCRISTVGLGIVSIRAFLGGASLLTIEELSIEEFSNIILSYLLQYNPSTLDTDH